VLKADLKTLPGYEEASIKEVAIRTCIVPGNAAPTNPLVEELNVHLYGSQTHYREKNVTARFSVSEDELHNLTIRTYAESMNPHNWCTGYWSTTWTLTPSHELSGTATTHVYTFEDSTNVQMRASRDFASISIPVDELAENVVQKMVECETDFLKDISDEDAIMTGLKQIRRILPITRTRMKWYVPLLLNC
jgi:F-actin capping protein alpha subunit